MFECYSSEHFAAVGAVAEGTVMLFMPLPDLLHYAYSCPLEASKIGCEGLGAASLSRE